VASATSDSQDDAVPRAVGSEPHDPAEDTVAMLPAATDEGMWPTDGVGERPGLSPASPSDPPSESTDRSHGTLEFAVMDEAWFSAPKLDGIAGAP
jgi:hypothetical protein